MEQQEPVQVGADEDVVLRFSFLGRDYEVRPDEINAKLAQECRVTTGISSTYVFSSINRYEFDIDIICALIWLSRRQAGEPAVRNIGRRTISLWEEISTPVRIKDVATFDVQATIEDADPETVAGS